MKINSANAHQTLRGPWALLPTPFSNDESRTVDLDGFARNLQFVSDYGAHIFCVACGVGESWSLQSDEVVELTRTARDLLSAEAIIVVGVGDPSLTRARQLLARLESAGADLAMIMPPAYPKLEEAALLNFYRSLSEVSALPFQIYPIEANPPFSFDLVRALIEEIPNTVSIKDVNHNLSYSYRLHRQFGDAAVIVYGRRGETEARLLWYYPVGIQAYYSNVINFRPDLAMEYWRALENSDAATVAKIAERLEPYAELFPDLPELGGPVKYRNIQVLKEVMNLSGLAAGPVRPPLVDLNDEERAHIRSAMESCALLWNAAEK